MFGVANAPNGAAAILAGTPYKAAAKSGTAQVFSYETYNASKLAERLRDHKLMIAYAPYDNPKVAVTILENGGGPGSRYWSARSLTTSCWAITTVLPDAPPSPPRRETVMPMTIIRAKYS